MGFTFRDLESSPEFSDDYIRDLKFNILEVLFCHL